MVFLPTSKLKSDPGYDPRWDMVSSELERLCPSCPIEVPFTNRDSTEPYHTSDRRRDPAEIRDNYDWLGFDQQHVDQVYLIDDVFTTGAHYKAAKHLIHNNLGEGVDVRGIFWTRHRHDDNDGKIDFSRLLK